MINWKLIGAISLSGVAAVGLVALSHVPYASEDATMSALRLSWRTRSVRREHCRTPTPEELADVPVHMRLAEICESQRIPYTLRVLIDGRIAVERSVTSIGARADRPLYVYEELRVSPGTYAVQVQFSRDRDGDEEQSEETHENGAAPVALQFSRSVSLSPGTIVLITYDESTRQLVAR